MRSRDYFITGFTKALERRAKERTKQQTVRKFVANAVAIDVVTSDAIITTQQDVDKLYKQAIVQSMIALIQQRKMK